MSHKIVVTGGLPLVQFIGPIYEQSGAELAAALMRDICIATEDDRRPLSDSVPRVGPYSSR